MKKKFPGKKRLIYAGKDVLALTKRQAKAYEEEKAQQRRDDEAFALKRAEQTGGSQAISLPEEVPPWIKRESYIGDWIKAHNVLKDGDSVLDIGCVLNNSQGEMHFRQKTIGLWYLGYWHELRGFFSDNKDRRFQVILGFIPENVTVEELLMPFLHALLAPEGKLLLIARNPNAVLQIIVQESERLFAAGASETKNAFSYFLAIRD